MSAKRVIIATIFGFITGFLCYFGGRYGLKVEMSTVHLFMILLHRGLLGFVIGISALRVPWALHGILLGLIIGLPSVPGIILGEGSLAYFVAGAVWGFIIELFTSVVFKAKSIAA
ncbi:hypothetical protein AMJ44_07510 [candidate division WOR-1 bacterium DG_54_3]|jgi:hypothetical protein|uniref:Uncharacterized protein n=1 Tax=candidate division WOR-1 bacterium DG_54_3 TaxID=1703775 RepID=A0A0S7XX52_UNCSA|nr:MAG: hypothetical protein AMJ44_07510 [candidate division WOR-1 bacterium DG_54_3]